MVRTPRFHCRRHRLNSRRGTKIPKACVCVCACVLNRGPTLCNPPDFSVYGIIQARIHWSGLPYPPPGGLPDPGTKPVSLKSPALAGGFFSTTTTWEAPNSSGVEVEMND